MFVMKSLPLLLIANFLYGSVVVVSSANFGTSRSSPSSAKLQTDRSLPPLVPPKLVEDDDDFDERDLDLSPALPHSGVQLRPSYWAPTLETLAPEEAEFYRKALVSAMIGSRPSVQMKRGEAGHRSMSMLRMGRGSSGVSRRSTAGSDGARRSMTMLRMGRGFDEEEGGEEEGAVKRTMGMLRMGRRGANGEEDFRKSMSMLRMGRGAMMEDADEEDSEDQQQQLKRSMGMLRMGRRNLASSSDEDRHDGGDALDDEDGDEGESKRSMGMLRMGRAMASKNVDRGALNMLRMGKREIISSSSRHQLIGSSAAAADKSSSSSSSN